MIIRFAGMFVAGCATRFLLSFEADLHFQVHAAAEGEQQAGDYSARVSHKGCKVPQICFDIAFAIPTHRIGDAQSRPGDREAPLLNPQCHA